MSGRRRRRSSWSPTTTRAVVGVVVGGDGGERRIGARKGVVLACGGFEWNAEMVKTFIGYEVKPLSPWSNTGDGHRMAMEVGAKLGGMTGFFSYGVIYDPWEKGRDGNPLPQMMMGLGAGSIIVNQAGSAVHARRLHLQRLLAPFRVLRPAQPRVHEQGAGLGRVRCRAPRAGVMGAKPGIELDLVGPDGRGAAVWLVLAGSVAELAAKMGVDPDDARGHRGPLQPVRREG